MKKMYKDMMAVEATLPETEIVIARKIKSKHNQFYLYYNRINQELHFGIELEGSRPSSSKLPNSKGFQTKWSTLPFTSSSKPALILSCVGVQNVDFFLRVTEDLKNCLQHIKDEERMATNAISRIIMWQDFFKKHGENQFAPEKQKGLYGELRTIELVSNDLSLEEVIKGWMGPRKTSQDFHLDLCHMETKVTSRKDPATIRIHGFEQLTPPVGKELYLHTLSVKTSETSGETVMDIEGHISAKLLMSPEVLEQFHSKLLSYGYPVGGFNNPMHFEIEEEKFYKVQEGFPRIERRPGIYNIEYDILLADIEPFKIDYSTVRKSLGVLHKAI
ncbi:PD-(D/E)XK motif protein [Lederbergia citri]|uniref:PD-(D/E)XK motif protein n=1 Tax=Lederbergia citri TaxID=2833580 RepID=A0A942YFB3_9BACI|nr:PD-(D/E)XK motif protein [Lederbergia citri]MBS4194312.1 PD-(D/E)XK motif protein [Lederbergia citri]